ncbi:MAG: MBOAT family O-acyltransferase, partial [Candidatus Omnitrophota bacterium]|nr:MBOAT family O-acyltransferase [Candidatus Omnitrophota bacterium]
MGECKDKGIRRIFLIVSLVANLSLLFSFKYLSFLNESFRGAFGFLHIPYNIPYLNIILPMGISFHTFQAMAYTLEVYRGNQKPERHFGKFALYIAFFPQMVAGPIERASSLIPQFYKKHILKYSNLTYGLKRMAWGFLKKVVIADRLALLVNRVYNDPHQFQGAPLIIATIFFAFQIYCDFSAYTDIAIGSARVMGFKLKENFHSPYLATSVRDFWKRWHISLTSWFRDFLYIPLGGNRVAQWRWYFNLLIVFLLSGLWHGANWTFIIWGALHGSYLIFAILTQKVRQKFVQLIGLTQVPRVYKAIQIAITFLLMTFAWIFFRANSLSDAIYVVTHLFDFSTTSQLLRAISIKHNTVIMLGLSKVEIALSFGFIFFIQIFYWLQEKKGILGILSSKPALVRFS